MDDGSVERDIEGLSMRTLIFWLAMPIRALERWYQEIQVRRVFLLISRGSLDRENGLWISV